MRNLLAVLACMGMLVPPSISLADPVQNPGNGHYYEVISQSPIWWSETNKTLGRNDISSSLHSYIVEDGSSFASTGTTSLSFDLIPWDGEIRPGGSVLIGSSPIFDADETTIEAWYKPESYPTGAQDEGRTIIWNGDGTGGHDPYWILLNPGGFLEARVDYESPYQHRVISSAGPLELNIWHHFALVISTGETRLYVNGIQQPGTILGAGSACKGTNYIAIGRSMWHWNPYEGLIDEMRIWSVARTSEEIRENMWAGSVTGNEPDLISYWDFEQGTEPDILYDLTANHIDGEIHGALWYGENAPSRTANHALDFGEVGDFNYVIVGSNSVFDTDEITVEAWIKLTSLPTGTHVFEGRSTIAWNGDGASGKDPYIFYINEFGKLEAHVDFRSGAYLYIYGSTVLTLGVWHHVALTVSPTKTQLFLNGCKDGEITYNYGPAVKGHSYLAFARHMWYKNPLGGLMDEIRIWDTVRTEEEIRDNRWAGYIQGDNADLVGYWDFNEGSGQILYDITQNQNHGTIYGATWTEDSAPDSAPEPLAPVTDLSVSSGAEGNTIELQWTAPENITTAYMYIVRYNTAPITESNWDESSDVDGEPRPGLAGSIENMTIAVPYPGANYYFAIKTQADSSNTSDISISPCTKAEGIHLYTGWNLVAFISPTVVSIEGAMSSISGKYTSVWRYDNSILGWQRYLVDGPAFLNNLDEIGPGCGYWIYATEDCTWSFGGGGILSPASSAIRKPPFILYGKIMQDMKHSGVLNVSLKVGNIEVGSYTLGSNPRYENYYVFEISLDGSFREDDVAQIYVDDVPAVCGPITLGRMGTIGRHDISYMHIPIATKLFQNYPNPFNPETWLPYQLADGSEVTIRIYSATGGLIRLLDLGYREPGSYVSKDTAAYWDGVTDTGEHVSSGVYFYSIQAGDYRTVKKMIAAQ